MIKYYFYHIFYYIFYKKYRILMSNVWVEAERVYPSVFGGLVSDDWLYYNSLNGKYFIRWYHKINYFNIYLKGVEIKFFPDDGISGQVCAFFVKNHKDKFVKLEDKAKVQRDFKLKELGIW